LTITQLAKLAGGTARGGEVEAAGITAANEGVGAGSESCESDEVLHHYYSSANVEGVVEQRMYTRPFRRWGMGISS
jgi:hypothetical protein